MGPIANYFFGCNNHQFLLDIIAVYHLIQNQRNIMIQSRENALKPHIWAILGQILPKFGPRQILVCGRVISKIILTREVCRKQSYIFFWPKQQNSVQYASSV